MGRKKKKKSFFFWAWGRSEQKDIWGKKIPYDLDNQGTMVIMT